MTDFSKSTWEEAREFFTPDAVAILPVASTDVGDVADILPEGSRGAIVEPGDPAALAGALEALAADADRRHREGQANRQRCLDDFELTASLDRFAAVYEQVADSPSAAVGSGR